MTTQTQALQYARDALARHYGHQPTEGEVLHLAGVARLETSWGDGWKGAGKGSFNMGAIQCGSGWKGDRFSYVDTHPNADGTNTPYRIDFRKYPTAEAGWDDLVKVVYVNRGRESVRVAAAANDTYRVSERLHATGYYEGFGATVKDRIQNHYRALSKHVAAARGDSAPVVPAAGIPPKVRLGSTSDVVALLQAELGLVADGVFGPVTEATLREWQAAHGLSADGVAGAATWSALFAASEVA